MISRTSGLLFLFSLLPGVLAAQTVIQTLTFGPEDFSVSASATTEHAPTFSGTINPFDATLGTLESVTLAFSFTFTSSTTVGPSGGGAGMNGSSTIYWNDIVLGGTGNGTGGGAGPFGTVVLTLTLADNAPVQNLTLAEAVGTEPIDFIYAGSLTVSANTSLQLDSGTLQLTYAYAPAAIPEPSTYAALAGLTALGLALRRRRQPAV